MPVWGRRFGILAVHGPAPNTATRLTQSSKASATRRVRGQGGHSTKAVPPTYTQEMTFSDQRIPQFLLLTALGLLAVGLGVAMVADYKGAYRLAMPKGS